MKKLFTTLMFIVTIMLSACNDTDVNNTIYVFSQPGCGHCINAHDYMNRYYKDYNIKEINIREGANINQLMRFAGKFNVPQNSLGTPFIVIGDKYIMGWGNEQMKEFNRLAKEFKNKE
jgi:glutaredoxin